MNSKAYITVLSNDGYLPGALCLKKCLDQVNSKYPLYVLITNNVSKEVENKLNNFQIKTIRRNHITLPENIVNKNNSAQKARWNYTFDKLIIFELTQFKKLVFIDSDIYVRENIDKLFDMPDMSAVIDKHIGPNITPRCMKLTSGVMVIEPQKGRIQKFQEIIKTILDKRDAIGDQDILQEYDPDWENKNELHMKNKYNVFFPYAEYYIKCQEYTLDDMAGIHFIYTKKPWMFDGKNRNEDYLNYIMNFTKTDYEESHIPDIGDCILCGSDNMKIILDEYFKILDKVQENIK